MRIWRKLGEKNWFLSNEKGKETNRKKIADVLKIEGKSPQNKLKGIFCFKVETEGSEKIEEKRWNQTLGFFSRQLPLNGLYPGVIWRGIKFDVEQPYWVSSWVTYICGKHYLQWDLDFWTASENKINTKANKFCQLLILKQSQLIKIYGVQRSLSFAFSLNSS